jgi:hypothetical protein
MSDEKATRTLSGYEAFCAAAPAMLGVGAWRLYFNRHGAVGLPWCVAPDSGGWELAVSGIDVQVPSETVFAPKATPDDEDGRPSAWIACAGRLTITAGVAAIATP